MPPAARVNDVTNHPGKIVGVGARSVMIGNRPAAVAGPMAPNIHHCALPPISGPHPPTPIAGGSKTVLIGGLPAARLGDRAGCGARIISGARDVLIGG
jgi:uncharacterized Zn-binding protein involved in type VI secretion